jgi:hypothetical protein
MIRVLTLVVVALAAPPFSGAAPRGLHGNNFFSNCYFSHTAPDDPIVHPRRPGRSHAHRRETRVELHVNFPDCWDGKHLDTPDHRSHMAYSRNWVCPASHPVKVPLIRLNIRYPLLDGRGVELASGGQLTAHADFFNAWDERKLAKLVDACFHGRPCNR